MLEKLFSVNETRCFANDTRLEIANLECCKKRRGNAKSPLAHANGLV